MLRETGSPKTSQIANRIRREYIECKGVPPRFIPGERALSERYGVARGTLRSALGILIEEGLLRAEQGRGYRTLARVSGMRPGSSLAIMWPYESEQPDGVMQAVSEEAVSYGGQVLLLEPKGKTPEAIAEEIRKANIWGAVLTEDYKFMRDAIKLSGLPAVFINSSVRGEPVDYIIQDNFSGGSIAADYLLGRGHTRVAWFGQVGESHHSLERFAGAGSTLTNRGHRFDSELIVNPDTRNLREAAHEMLANSKRPTGVLALWTDFARTCAEVAVERGLRLGEDIEIVAWNYETAYQKDPSNGFPGGHIPPTIVWNPYSMARIAISRLLWHLKEPDLDPLKIMIPTKLMLPEN